MRFKVGSDPLPLAERIPTARSLGSEWRLSPSPNFLLQMIAHQTRQTSVYSIVISLLYGAYYNIYSACIVNTQSRLGAPIIGLTVC